jgi:hypothetical protein
MTDPKIYKPHISFSELSNWYKCSWYHKLTYIDEIGGFNGNTHTAFGKAVHNTAEQLLLENIQGGVSYFLEDFKKELEALDEYDEKLAAEMYVQGEELVDLILPALRIEFGEFEVVSAEYPLYESCKEELDLDYDFSFKGFIDLVIRTKDGKLHIIDYKTCSWGWRAEKKADKMTNYQMVLYKYFYARKNDIELKNVDCHFALIKRTASKNRVEIFKVTSGQKKVANSLDFTKKAVYNIHKELYIKNKLNCTYCEFKHTKHCPR